MNHSLAYLNLSYGHGVRASHPPLRHSWTTSQTRLLQPHLQGYADIKYSVSPIRYKPFLIRLKRMMFDNTRFIYVLMVFLQTTGATK